MDQSTFDTFATELAQRVDREHKGSHLFVAVFPPGSFDGRAGPYSASTLPLELQPKALRALADGLERNAATLIFTKVRRESAPRAGFVENGDCSGEESCTCVACLASGHL
jgi:hypothetical protein